MDKTESGTGELGPIEVVLEKKPARKWKITATAYRNAAGNGNGEPVWEEVPVSIADTEPDKRTGLPAISGEAAVHKFFQTLSPDEPFHRGVRPLLVKIDGIVSKFTFRPPASHGGDTTLPSHTWEYRSEDHFGELVGIDKLVFAAREA